jgi:hypothetical protein
MGKKLILVAAFVLASTGLTGAARQDKKNDGKETNNPAVCPVASRGGTAFQQTVGITANWHLRPVD